MEEKIDSSASDPRIYLAAERTELALERTHLAWIRTVITMMASGFAIDHLMEVLHSTRLEAGTALFKSAHITGVLLTLTGTIVIACETIYYVKRSRQLSRLRDTTPWRAPSGMIVSILIFFLGIILVYFILSTGSDTHI